MSKATEEVVDSQKQPDVEIPRLALAFLTRKRLPKVAESVERGKFVPDDKWEVGKKYITEDGHLCTVLTHVHMFEDYTAYILYSNGAIRWISHYNKLFEPVRSD